MNTASVFMNTASVFMNTDAVFMNTRWCVHEHRFCVGNTVPVFMNTIYPTHTWTIVALARGGRFLDSQGSLLIFYVQGCLV